MPQYSNSLSFQTTELSTDQRRQFRRAEIESNLTDGSPWIQAHLALPLGLQLKLSDSWEVATGTAEVWDSSTDKFRCFRFRAFAGQQS